jgi:protein tyrosine/serine phosphatase
VLRVFSRRGSLPALVHCAHGKDRTGVVVLLLLAACGVGRDAILGDYVEVGLGAGVLGVVFGGGCWA